MHVRLRNQICTQWMDLVPFLQKCLPQKPPCRKGAERGFQRTQGVQKGCRKGVLAQKEGCTKGAQRVQKGCRKGARTPLPAKEGGVENPAKRTVLDK